MLPNVQPSLTDKTTNQFTECSYFVIYIYGIFSFLTLKKSNEKKIWRSFIVIVPDTKFRLAAALEY